MGLCLIRLALTLLFLGSYSVDLSSQPRTHDSLLLRLQDNLNKQEKGDILLKIVRKNIQTKPDTAWRYLSMLKEGDYQINNQQTSLLSLEAQYWKKRKNFLKSSNHFKRCIDASIDKRQKANCQYELGDNYFKQGALDLAIEHLLQASSLYASLSLHNRLSATYNKLGKVFDQAGYPTKAVDAYSKALAYFYEQGKYKNAMQCEKNLGEVLLKMKNHKEAKVHFLKSYRLANKYKWQYMVHALDLSFAREYLRNNEVDSSKLYAFRAYQFYDIQKKNYPSMISSRLLLGDISLKEKKVDKAIEYYEEALQLGLERKRSYQIAEAHHKLSIAHEIQDEFSKSIFHLRKSMALNDSIIHVESQQKILSLNEAYESKVKDNEINNLNHQNSIQELELSRSRLQTYIAVFGVLSASIIAVLLFRSLRIKRESERSLQKKNEIISTALSDKELLLKEIHHRVKNNLQVISSLLGLQSEYIKDDSALMAINEGRNRVQSMALIHQNLYKEDNLSGINVKIYLEKLIKGLFDTYNLEQGRIELIMIVDDLLIDVDTVVPLGLIANELISNALKHAYPNNNKGQLSIQLFKRENHLIFIIKDDGIGMNPALINNNIKTFGFQMIQAFVDKLEAEMHVISNKGTLIELTIPYS